uniref:Helix-turn-helix XrE-family like protein n=1 Tax=Dulem virus 30 TaxID=3145748 RepID=A0AAU8B346_9CAUD
MKLSDLLKKTRKAKHLTQEEFAKALQITRGTLSHLERGRAPSLETAKKIETYYNESIEKLVGDKEVHNLSELKTTNMLIDLLIEKGEIKKGYISEYAQKSIWNTLELEIKLKLEQLENK